jgi:glutaredoxin
MNHKLTLYSRHDCCLCNEMKTIIRDVSLKIPLELEEIDVDASTALREKFGHEVPVLFVDGRKAFKYRVTESALAKRLGKSRRSRWSFAIGVGGAKR